VLGINVFGDGLRDALDPRSQVKVHAGGRRRRHRAVVEAATEETS
jgi:hypothetical protein